MPRQMLYFFSRCLDARRTYRGAASEILDMLQDNYMKEDMDTMRSRMSNDTDAEELEAAAVVAAADGEGLPSPNRLVKTSSWSRIPIEQMLNHSDNWKVIVTHRIVAKKFIIFSVNLTPPRETHTDGRIHAELLIKALRQLHVRSELQFPPPEAGKVGRPCAPFPGKKRLYVKDKNALALKRCNELMQYLEAAFMTALLAEFWIDKLLDYDTAAGGMGAEEQFLNGDNDD
jgi:hypothetical protein